MKLPIKYHYSYFILPFVIEEKTHDKYIEKIFESNLFEYITFSKKGNPDLFLNFSNDLTNSLLDQNSYKNTTKAVKINKVKKQNLAIFEYKNKRDLVGILNLEKEDNAIEFNIQNINLYIFKNGICFLNIKTNIESKNFEDVLDFNYRFREIISDLNNIQKYQNIKIAESKYKSLEDFKSFIEKIICVNLEDVSNYTNVDNFFTFAYTCLENSVWNENTNKDVLTNIVQKYMKIYSSSYNTDISQIGANLQTEYEFRKIGITKTSSNLLCSGVDPYNFGYLPVEYETVYLLAYITALFYKISLVFLEKRIKNLKENDLATFKSILRELNAFNKDFWSIEVSNSQRLTRYFNSLIDGLNLNTLYLSLITRINLIYKENKIEESLVIKKNILFVLLILSIFIVLFKLYGW